MHVLYLPCLIFHSLAAGPLNELLSFLLAHWLKSGCCRTISGSSHTNDGKWHGLCLYDQQYKSHCTSVLLIPEERIHGIVLFIMKRNMELEDKYYLAERRRKSSCGNDSWPVTVNIYINFWSLQSPFQCSFNLFYIFANVFVFPLHKWDNRLRLNSS